MKAKKKNKLKFWLILTIAIVIASIFIGFIFRRPVIYYAKLSYHFVFNSESQQFKDENCISNLESIYIPEGSVFGLDISRHQGEIDWDKLSNYQFEYHKIDFVFIKATESDNWSDKNFFRNWKEAKNHNIVRGAYHFFDPNESAEKQMNNFFNKVNLEKGDLPPMLDVEQESRISTSEYRSKVLKCLKLLEHHYKLKPLLYVNKNFYDSYFSTDGFNNYPLWISSLVNTEPIQREWVIWQFSHTGIIPGIGEYVDVNVFNGSKEDFKILIKD